VGQNLGNGVRSSATGVAVDDVSGSQVAVSSGRRFCFGPVSSISRNFREICNTPPIHGCRVNRSSRGWIFPMGRKAKGDRHTIFTSMPTEAAQIVKAEATSLGCYIGDYIGWLVCDHFELSAEVPIGEVTDHPDPLPAANGRVRYRAMLPREAADLVIPEAECRGNSLGDFVAKILCDRFGVPFEPRVKKKALRAWQMAAEAGEQLPMTG